MRDKKKSAERKNDRHQTADERLAYRPREAAPIVGIGYRTLVRHIATGKIKSFRRGGCRLISRDALKEFASGN